MSGDTKYYGGLEGGASNTVVVVLDSEGRECGRSTGPGSNAWLKSIEDVAAMIARMTKEALTAGGLPESTHLVSMGLCMSGFSHASRQEKLKGLLATYDLADSYDVHNDSVGAAFTVTPTGGFVIICGTGSIAHVATTTVDRRVGGYGNLFSDEGSAYSIATAALRLMVRALDDVATPMGVAKADAEAVRDIVFKHLSTEESKVECVNDLVRVFFHEFDKARVASLARLFAEAARDGNEFLRNIFHRAGQHLGRMIRAAATDAPRAADGSFAVLAVGSVWKSLDLLRDGLIETACATEPPAPSGNKAPLPKFTILKQKETAAIGAAAVAATHAGISLPLNFGALSTPLLEVDPSDKSWKDLTATDGPTAAGDSGDSAPAGAGSGAGAGSDASPALIVHKGGCHCGAVRFEIDHTPEVTAWDCNCSICLMKRNVHFMVPKSRLRMLKGEDALTEYRFNTKVARHMFCKHCGVQSFYQPRSNPDGWGVTLNCIDEGTITKITVKKYDGQNWEASHVSTGIAAYSKE